MLSILFLYFGLSLCLSAGLTPLIRYIAIARGWVAHPTQDRWHKNATALMGGMAIFFAIAIPVFLLADFMSIWHSLVKMNGTARQPSLAAAMLIGAAFLFCLGLIDDFRNIKPHSKLIGQILAASFIVFLGFRLHWFESLTLDTMATLFWIVGITNAFNLIDNMDGLCAGVGAVASISLSVLYFAAAPDVSILTIIIAGALLGFLIYNFNPAKIFMGDCGSLVIGFSVSVLTLYSAEIRMENQLATIAVPILVLLVPILDTSLVTVIRILSGRKASTGGRDHTSHRLVLIGFSERKAVLFLYMVGAVAGLAAVYVRTSDSMTSPAVIIPIIIAIFLMGVYLAQLRVYPEKEFSVLRDRSFTPVLLELTYKRHILLVLFDFVLVAFAYYLSYRLRFEGAEFSFYFQVFLKSLPIVIGCKIAVFFIMGIYSGLWSYISTSDIFLFMRASLVGSILSIVTLTFIYQFEHFSKGVFLIDWIIASSLLLGVRGSFRMFLETQKRRTLSGDNVLIYGAGRGGELLLREILNNGQLHVKPIGFIDDDALKGGKKIQGYPILGNISHLAQIHKKKAISGIIISFNDMEGRHRPAYGTVKEFCREHHLFLKKFSVALHDLEF